MTNHLATLLAYVADSMDYHPGSTLDATTGRWMLRPTPPDPEPAYAAIRALWIAYGYPDDGFEAWLVLCADPSLLHRYTDTDNPEVRRFTGATIRL